MEVVAELGSNWWVPSELSYDRVHQSLTEIKSTGADAVKIQLFSADKLYSKERAPKLHDRARQFEFPIAWLTRLSLDAIKLDLCLYASVFDLGLASVAVGHVHGFKIASGDLTNENLFKGVLALCSMYDLPFSFSTGAGTMEEIGQAVKWTTEFRAQSVTMYNCVSKYPAQPDDYSLRWMLPYLDDVDAIGLSDHTVDLGYTAGLAVALGYTAFEKHFKPRCAHPQSPDYDVALDPLAFQSYIRSIQRADGIAGTEDRGYVPEEDVERLWARRGSDGLRPTDGVRE